MVLEYYSDLDLSSFCSILFSFYGSFCLKGKNFTHGNCCEPKLAKQMHDFESARKSTISDLEGWEKSR